VSISQEEASKQLNGSKLFTKTILL